MSRLLRPDKLCMVLALAALGFSSAAGAQDWTWSTAMYAWASDISVDAKVRDREVIDSEFDFGTLVQKLDMAFAAHVEGQRGAHGVLFDVNYVNLGDEGKTVDLPGPLPGDVTFRGNVKMTLFEVGGLWNPRADMSGFTLIYGVRLVDAKVALEADFSSQLFDDPDYETGGTLYDAMVGARWNGELSERWNLNLRADFATGGTEFTWNAVAGVSYELGQTGKYSLLAGYRHLKMQLREEDDRVEVENELTMSGAYLAFGIKF